MAEPTTPLGEVRDPIVDDVLEALAEGRPLDWDDLQARHPQYTDRWRRLRRVEAVGDAFRSVREQEGYGAERTNSEAPTTWGPLELRARIGEGSYGEVWHAVDGFLDRPVALKLARPGAGVRAADLAEEGRLLAAIEHPGVIRVHGGAVHDGRAGIWMDLAEGRSLERRLEEDGRLSQAEAREVGRQLAEALTAVHAAGVVHGDVKSANVFRRDGGRIVLGDFGSSLDAADTTARPGSATPAVAAPEILRGNPANARSDIYSLGVLLYEQATGTLPVEGSSLSALLDAHEAGPVPIRDRRPDLDPSFAAVVDRALATDPAERWPTARSFADALSSVGAPAAPRRTRPPWPLAVAGILGVAFLGFLVMLRPSASAPDSSPVPTESRESPASPPSSAETGFGVGLYRTGRPEPLAPGDRLRVGDALHLRVRRNDHPLWLYLVNEDAAGRVYLLFPLAESGRTNPIPPGDVRLPGAVDGSELDWVVTSEAGHESFLLVSSREPLPDLEGAVNHLQRASRDHRPEAPSTFEEPRRGVGGLEQSAEGATPTTLLELALRAEQEASPGSEVRTEIVTLRGGR